MPVKFKLKVIDNALLMVSMESILLEIIMFILILKILNLFILGLMMDLII
jgi:hypothetical protein